MSDTITLDGKELECYYKRNGKSFYRNAKTKEKIISMAQVGTGVYNMNFNTPAVLNKTLEFKTYSAILE